MSEQPITIHSEWTPCPHYASAASLRDWLSSIIDTHQPSNQLPEARVVISKRGMTVQWTTGPL